MTATEMGIVFLGVLGGYWAVSALIDRARRRAEPPARPAAATPPTPAVAAPAPSLPEAPPAAAAEPDRMPAPPPSGPARSVWDEFNGGAPR